MANGYGDLDLYEDVETPTTVVLPDPCPVCEGLPGCVKACWFCDHTGWWPEGKEAPPKREHVHEEFVTGGEAGGA